MKQQSTLYFATVVHCTGDPWQSGAAAVQVLTDGYLKVTNGLVESVGVETDLTPEEMRECIQVDYRGYIVTPGFIDGHLHYPQTGVIASYGTQLLEWLEKIYFSGGGKIF